MDGLIVFLVVTKWDIWFDQKKRPNYCSSSKLFYINTVEHFRSKIDAHNVSWHALA